MDPALRLARRLAPQARWRWSPVGRCAILLAGPFYLSCHCGPHWSVRILWEPGRPATIVLWASSWRETKHEGPEEALQAALGWLRAVRMGLQVV